MGSLFLESYFWGKLVLEIVRWLENCNHYHSYNLGNHGQFHKSIFPKQHTYVVNLTYTSGLVSIMHALMVVHVRMTVMKKNKETHLTNSNKVSDWLDSGVFTKYRRN